jgi:alpha-glucoside transport system permease protein
MSSVPTVRTAGRHYSFLERIIRFVQRTPLHITLLLICAVWILPAFTLLVSSFRPAAAVARTGWWEAFKVPFQWTLDLYRQSISAQGMGQSFINSLYITIPATIIPIMIAAFAAYAFAWMEFPGRNVIFVIVVGLLVVPLQMTLIPLLKLYNHLHLTGTFPGIWIAHTGYGLPLAVYLLRNFFGTLPKEMLESAELDGASGFTAFFRLILPLSVPAIASMAIFQFLWVWNDLLVALIFLGGYPQVAPLTVSIADLVSSLGAGWQLLTSAAFISMLLPLFIFIVLQRYFVRGLLAGSVKG